MLDLTGLQLKRSELTQVNDLTNAVQTGSISRGEWELRVKEIAESALHRQRKSQRWNGIRDALIRFLPDRLLPKFLQLCSRSIYQQRLKACHSCMHSRVTPGVQIDMCSLCGCAIKLKAKLKWASCPDKDYTETKGTSRWIE